MKNPRNAIDRFCARHPNFGIPGLMKYIAIANAVFWIMGMINTRFTAYMTFSPLYILRGQVWRLVSFVFIPPGYGVLALIAVYFYYWIGTTLEKNWGTAQFTLYYLSGVLMTVLYGFVIFFIKGISVNLTAHYIYLSMFFSFAALFPDLQVLLMFIIPIKMKYLAYVDAALFLVGIFTTPFPENLLPVVAVLNFIIFCGGDILYSIHRGRPTKGAVNFRRESEKIKRQQQSNLYRHKCCVCGRTDADYPDLEFRYCSNCAGYRCFCAEHINNHIHFTDENM